LADRLPSTRYGSCPAGFATPQRSAACVPRTPDPQLTMTKGRKDHGRGERTMEERIATCRCGQLQAVCLGEPVRVSVCHCLDCQRRTGSAFAAQARWPDAQVTLTGVAKSCVRVADSGHRAIYSFCSECGSTVTYQVEGWPGLTAVPIGAFADPTFPPQRFSVYEHRKHPWTLVLGDEVEHSSTPSSARRPGTDR
jgi:hypothetical protein